MTRVTRIGAPAVLPVSVPQESASIRPLVFLDRLEGPSAGIADAVARAFPPVPASYAAMATSIPALLGATVGSTPTVGVGLAAVPGCLKEPEPTFSKIDEILLSTRSMLRSGKLKLPDALIDHAKANYFEEGVERLTSWQSFVNDAANRKLPEALKVELANRFINETTAYVSEPKDRWKSAPETLASGLGDCEDYVVAKYATLRLLGVPPEHLAMAVAPVKSTGELHAVLLYTGASETRVLDNRSESVAPMASADLKPVMFDFNELGARSHVASFVSDVSVLFTYDTKVASTLARLRPLLLP